MPTQEANSRVRKTSSTRPQRTRRAARAEWGWGRPSRAPDSEAPEELAPAPRLGLQYSSACQGPVSVGPRISVKQHEDDDAREALGLPEKLEPGRRRRKPQPTGKLHSPPGGNGNRGNGQAVHSSHVGPCKKQSRQPAEKRKSGSEGFLSSQLSWAQSGPPAPRPSAPLCSVVEQGLETWGDWLLAVVLAAWA